jgi:ankyrin repeat protein
MAALNAQAHDLWKKAVDSLDPRVISGLDPAKTGMRDIVTAVFRVAQAKRDESAKKRWRISRRGKQDIIVRDVMEKIIFWIDRFKDVGDNAVQCDPGHAALPWAAVRFILQALVNYTEVEREILEGIELVTRLLASFREVEKIYLGAGATLELQDALVSAYATILETLAEAVRYLSQSKKIHVLKAPVRLAGGDNIKKLLDREHQVLRFTTLVDGQRLLDVSAKVSRTAELSAITEKAVEEQKYQSVLSWLSTSKYLEHHDEQRKLRTPGTGTWLLRHAEYVSWQQESSSSILVVHGIPGCGKTILSSLVVDESTSISSPAHAKAALAFFYCSASVSEPDRRNAAGVLRSLVRQLTIAASRHPKIHSAVLAVYDSKVEAAKLHGFDLTPLHVHECEDLVVAALEDNPATLVIDALDEMDDPHDLMDSLQTISTKARNVIKIMITTRNSSQTKQHIPNAKMVQITLAENKSDVERFITSEFDLLALRRSISPDTRSKLVGSLVSGAGEMFQWAKLQLSQLQASKQPAIEQDLTDQLSTFARSTLDELYGTIFEVLLGSGEATQQMVVHAFSWILYAQEPLTIDALLTATARGPGRDAPTPEVVLDICRGFIHIDSRSQIVRFDHQSARSFLQSQTLFLPQQAQTLIALSCLRIFREPPLDDFTDLQPAQRPYDYAVLYFGNHVSILDADLIQDSTVRSMDDFFFAESETGLYAMIWMERARAMYDALPRSHTQKAAMEAITSESNSPLFPICVFNMTYILRNRTWPPTFDWNQRNESGYTALYAASFFGHSEVVTFLLDHHADPDIECGRLGQALQCAAFWGHHDVVRVLLDRGADPKLKRHFESATHAACKGNNEKVVVTLLQNGFNISTQDEYDSVESEIASSGLARAMPELQRHPLSAKSANGWTSQLATKMIASGEVNGLNYLLRKSPPADVIRPGSLAISALHGHEKMTIFLIDQGVNVNEAGELGTPLRCASLNGYNNICKVLLGRGAEVDHNGPFGGALHAAAMRGHLHTAKLFVDIGADVNIRGGYFGNPLQACAYHGHIELVQLLLAAKADVHATGFALDSLQAAVEGNRHVVVQLFLDAGLQPSEPLRYPGCTAYTGLPPQPNIIRDSSPKGHLRRELSRKEAHAGSRAPLDPLNPANGVPAYSPNEAMDLGESLRQGNEGGLQFALMTACRKGYVGIVEIMMSEKYRSRIELRKPLREATLSGHGDIVRTMLDQLLEQQPPYKGIFKDILLTSIPGSPRIFDEIMQRMKRTLPRHDVQSAMSTCLPKAASAGWVETVMTIVKECTTITSRRLAHAFKRACDEGRTVVASAIYHLADSSPISTPQLVRRTRAAAEDGHKELLQFLLSKCVEIGLEAHIDNMICLAAGDGKLDIVDVLLSWSARRRTASRKGLDTALIVAAQNRQEKVCARLISQGASPVHGMSVPRRSQVAIKGRKGRQQARKVCDSPEATDSSGSDSESDDDSGRRSPGLFPGYVTPEPETVEQDAIQSCLAGRARFQKGGGHLYSGPGPYWLVQDEAAQIRTLRILLDGIIGFDENHWSHKVCTAAEFCPPEVLDILFQRGVSARSVARHKNALQAAASRERWNFSTMQLLLQAGADQDLQDSDLRKALVSALAEFDDSLDSDALLFGMSDALFPAVESLDELFDTGCGAVVGYLLSRLPLEDASGNGYAVLLQAAAAAGRLGLVKMLIARNIDVNAMGSHYGTSLQAACRFGHTDIAEALLQAGADPNLIQGEYSTALRAAVVAESLPTILLLLQFQADTELTGPRGYRGAEPPALHLAVQNKQAAIAFALLDAGAHIESEQEDDSFPALLVSACGWGEHSVVRRLIEAGADLQATSTRASWGHAEASAMHAAICGTHHGVVQLLLSSGFDSTTASPNAKCSNDFYDPDDPDDSDDAYKPDNLLTFAVRKENTSIVTTLLHHLPRGCDAMLLQASKAAIEHNLVAILVQLLDAAWDAKSMETLVDLIRTACRTPHESIVDVLFGHFSTLDDEPDLDLALAAIDVREVRGEFFESWLWLCYAPYTAELFVEACIRGNLDLIRRGIDLGYRADSEDKWARSPFHLAAAQGRASVVQLLLETGTDVDRTHSTYGTALVTTLEGLSARALSRKSIEDSDRSYVAELAELENLRYSVIYIDSPMHSWHPLKRIVPFVKPRQFRALTTEYTKTIGLLLSKGARADCSPSRFGTPLTLAAFAGIDEVVELLILNGAKAHVAGGILGSPLSTAIDQGHMNIVDRLVSTLKRSEYLPSPGDTDLHRACEIGNPFIVGKLLDLGINPGTTDSKGRTALKISLKKLRSNRTSPKSGPSIVHLLIDADDRPILPADELVAVAKIIDSRFRSAVMDSILASMEPQKIPEESFIRLLRTGKAGNHEFIQQILEKKALASVTTAALASTYDIDTMSLLLEYDPSYIVTSATIDAIQTERKENARGMVETLLLRSPTLQPTESQVCEALTVECYQHSWLGRSSKWERSSLLDLMFSRNPNLSVTHQMLETVHNPGDLKVLLAHVAPGKRVVTDRVLEALAPPSEVDKRRVHMGDLLRMFLDFDPSVKVIPSEVAQQCFKDGNLDTIERLLDHDSGIVILSEHISSIIRSLKDYVDDDHRRFVEILGKHPGQYVMSDEVKTTVDSHFRQPSEKPLKDIYYSFSGWEGIKEQGRGANEGSRTDTHRL